MNANFQKAKKPKEWPVNARERDLEWIVEATEEFDADPGYRTREVLISLFSDYDLNQTAALGEFRITDYEVAIINHLYFWSLLRCLPSLRSYLYRLVGQTTRLQKMNAYTMSVLEEEPSVSIPAYENGLCQPLLLYHYSYQSFNINKDKSFAEEIIQVTQQIMCAVQELDDPNKKKEFLDEIEHSYVSMLNDLSYFQGNKNERILEFSRKDLTKLFSLEAKLLQINGKKITEKPLSGVLITQISNFILKSRHGYNQDYICKYLSEKGAESSCYNHEIWLNRIENLNDEREGHVVKELFDDRKWIKASWVGELDFETIPKFV